MNINVSCICLNLILNFSILLFFVEYQCVNGFVQYKKKKTMTFLRELASATGNNIEVSENKGSGDDSEKKGLTDSEKKPSMDYEKKDMADSEKIVLSGENLELNDTGKKNSDEGTGDEKLNKGHSCWSPLDANKLNGELEKLEGRYANAIQAFENSLGVAKFDKEMQQVLLQTRGTAIREVYRTGDPKSIPAGLNLGPHAMISLPDSILMFHRMKLRDSTNFRIDYLHNDIQNMALEVRISMNTLRLMGDCYRSIPVKVPSVLIYMPNHGVLEIVLGNVTYKMQGRLRVLKDRLNMEIVVSEIDYSSVNLVYQNNTMTSPSHHTLKRESGIVDFVDSLKTDLDYWMRDYFNDYLMYYKLPNPIPVELLEYDKKKSLALNQYFDGAIANLNKRIVDLGFDAIAIQKFKIISVDGLEFKIYFGALRGLDSMYRRSIATASKEGSTRTIDAHVGFSNLMMEYKYRAILPSSGVVTGSLILNADELMVHLKLTVKSPETVEIDVDSVQLMKPEALTVEGAGGRMIANFKFILENHIHALTKTVLFSSIRQLTTLTQCETSTFLRELASATGNNNEDSENKGSGDDSEKKGLTDSEKKPSTDYEKKDIADSEKIVLSGENLELNDTGKKNSDEEKPKKKENERYCRLGFISHWDATSSRTPTKCCIQPYGGHAHLSWCHYKYFVAGPATMLSRLRTIPGTGDEKLNKGHSCWSPLDANKLNGEMEKLEGRYANAIQAFENTLGVASFDKEMQEVLLQTRGTAIREVYRTGDPKSIPAGLNLGPHAMISLPDSILMFHRMKLRDSTNFRIDYLHNDIQNMALEVRISMNTLRLMGDCYRSIPVKVPSVLIYMPNHGVLEIVLGNVTYKMQGRLRVLKDRLNMEIVVSEIDYSSVNLVYQNNTMTSPSHHTLKRESDIVDFVDSMKTDLDYWMRDYFNDYLMYYKLPNSIPVELLEYDKKKSLALNQYFDGAIANLNKRIVDLGFDAIAIQKFKIISVDGLEFKIYFGALRGLNSMYRRSIATASKEGSTRTIDAHVGFSNLMMEYKYRAILPSSGVVTGSLILNADELMVHLKLTVKSPETVEIDVDSVQLMKPEALTVEGAGGRMIANFKFILENHIHALTKTILFSSIRQLTTLTQCVRLVHNGNKMLEDKNVDIAQELDELLTKVQPDLQDVIKRSFTNVAMQQSRKNGEQARTVNLDDTSYFAKNTQVNLSRLELPKTPTFHMQSLSLDLKSMALSLRCSLGDVDLRGIYCAYNENLYNLIPVMAEGHVMISLANMTADVNVGLIIKEDAFSFINPSIEFHHDEVVVKLSWPSPQKGGGYDFVTTEQLARHIDDLPLTAAVSLPLYALLRHKLLDHLSLVIRQATSISELVRCSPSMLKAYSNMIDSMAENGNKIVDMILINMRSTLLQKFQEVIQIPPLHATFLHKVGPISFIGKFETDTGWVKNLATINRVGDVSVSRPDPMRTTFRVILRIKDLQMGYDEYRIKAMGVSCNGRLVTAFNDNALHMALTVGLAEWEPYAQVDDLRVQFMDCTEVHITGLGAMSYLSKSVRSWSMGAGSSLVVPAISSRAHTQLHTALACPQLWQILQGAR